MTARELLARLVLLPVAAGALTITAIGFANPNALHDVPTVIDHGPFRLLPSDRP